MCARRERRRNHRLSLIVIIHRVVFNGRNTTNRFEQTTVIEPTYPHKRSVLGLVDVPLRHSLSYGPIAGVTPADFKVVVA